jgi:hypothetical protein
MTTQGRRFVARAASTVRHIGLLGAGCLARAARRLERFDPGAHGRIKGLRLVTSYGIAAMLGTMSDITRGIPSHASLATLAGGFALWACVSEVRGTRAESSRDLAILSAAAGIGAAGFALSTPLLARLGHHGTELALISGAFCVGWLRRYGATGTGIGSQIFIGQLLAYGAGLTPADLPEILSASAIAAVAAVTQRLLSGPAERPPPQVALPAQRAGAMRPEIAMGVQSALGALLIVLLNVAFGLLESAWAVTASTYVIAASATNTRDRVIRRLLGTAVGVPLGLAFLPLVAPAPLLAWTAAALAMVIYAMALPTRYDIACGAYAFTLIVTLAATGEQSISLLGARAWETVLGGIIGFVVASLVFPLRGESTLASGRIGTHDTPSLPDVSTPPER